MEQSWLELAKDARNAANTLLTDGRFRASVSRAYYAANSKITYELVATAMLIMPPGRDGPSHAQLRPLIESSMRNMRQDKRETLSELIGRLYTLRIDADYKPSVEVEGRDAREAISIMKKIFESF